MNAVQGPDGEITVFGIKAAQVEVTEKVKAKGYESNSMETITYEVNNPDNYLTIKVTPLNQREDSEPLSIAENSSGV